MFGDLVTLCHKLIVCPWTSLFLHRLSFPVYKMSLLGWDGFADPFLPDHLNVPEHPKVNLVTTTPWKPIQGVLNATLVKLQGLTASLKDEEPHLPLKLIGAGRGLSVTVEPKHGKASSACLCDPRVSEGKQTALHWGHGPKCSLSSVSGCLLGLFAKRMMCMRGVACPESGLGLSSHLFLPCPLQWGQSP